MSRFSPTITRRRHVLSLIAYAWSAIALSVGCYYAAKAGWVLLEADQSLVAAVMLSVAAHILFLTVGCALICRRTWRALQAEKWESPRPL